MISIPVPTIHGYPWKRARAVIRAQFERRTWASRAFRLADRIDGRPVLFTRIETPEVRMLIPQPKFGPTLKNLQTLGGSGKILGNLRREDLSASDLTGASATLDPRGEWAVDGVNLGLVQ